MKNFFAVQMPLNQIVPGGDDPAPAPAPAPSSHRGLQCEFCESTLAANGQVLRVGARAKRLRDLEDEIESRDQAIRERETIIAEQKQRIAELEAQLPKPKARAGW